MSITHIICCHLFSIIVITSRFGQDISIQLICIGRALNFPSSRGGSLVPSRCMSTELRWLLIARGSRAPRGNKPWRKRWSESPLRSHTLRWLLGGGSHSRSSSAQLIGRSGVLAGSPWSSAGRSSEGSVGGAGGSGRLLARRAFWHEKACAVPPPGGAQSRRHPDP